MFGRPKSSTKFLQREKLPQERVNVAIQITGGFGDVIVAARVLQALAKRCPNCAFYLFPSASLKLVSWLFDSCSYVDSVLPIELFESYSENLCDVSISLNTFAIINDETFQHERVRRLCRPMLEVYGLNMKRRMGWEPFIENHPVLDGAFARQAVALGFSRRDFLFNQLGLEAPADSRLELPVDDSKVSDITSRFPAYITINTGFDANFVITTATATKCYPTDQWTALIQEIKAAFPKLGIVQLGGPNSVAIPGVDINLVGKTTMAEAAGILRGARLHLDIEGGLVHLCACLGTKCCVLFGPTSVDYFGYPENLNLRSGTCPDCWWATERWMEVCPRRKPSCQCLSELTPAKILAAITPTLETTSNE